MLQCPTLSVVVSASRQLISGFVPAAAHTSINALYQHIAARQHGCSIANIAAPFALHTQAEKRRESIMVGLNKTRDQLSVSEERLRQLQLDLQRTQMDLLAKSGAGDGGRDAPAQPHALPSLGFAMLKPRDRRQCAEAVRLVKLCALCCRCCPAAGECSELEKQLSEVQASETALNNAKANLENKLEQVEELLANTVAARDELSGASLPDACCVPWPCRPETHRAMHNNAAAAYLCCCVNCLLLFFSCGAAGNVAALTEQLAEAQTSAASLDADLQELRAEHAKVRMCTQCGHLNPKHRGWHLVASDTC